MGNVCSPKSNKHRRKGSLEESQNNNEIEEEDTWTEQNVTEQLDKLLKDMQHHNLKRLREEVDSDMDTFILNNLLMCIQFFDNFEKSKDASHQIRRQKEHKMNEKLAQGAHEGMILGERRCHLLHGMGFVLSKNYIYRAPYNSGEEEYYGNYYYGPDPRNTFMCEGILPMEFIMSWDNLELYRNSEFESLQGLNYSSAKGSPPTLRFCMEEPDKKNNVPRGFIRLQSVDMDMSIDEYKPGTDSSYDYTYAGKYIDRVPEAASDSEAGYSDFSGSDIDRDELINRMNDSTSYLNNNGTNTFSSVSTNGSSSLERPKSAPLPDSAERTNKGSLREEVIRKNLAEKLQNRRPSGILPQNYPKLEKPTTNLLALTLTSSEPNIPEVKVNTPQTPPVTNNQPPTFGFGQPLPNMLHPPPAPYHSRLKNQKFSRSSPLLNGYSSGYETTSQASGLQSRNSSIASEEIRHKWQQLELKQLWQYPSRNRAKQDEEVATQEPLSNKCYIPVKHEVESDEESDMESETESMLSDEVKETQYDTRYYLNSTQFSSEYCSEFHYIGIKHGVPATAVSQAVVLGTTVRCAVEYIAEDHEEENFHLTHTYTPALHCKDWPPNYYFWFNQRMLNTKGKASGDQWPTADQIENIERIGINAVPLGFRSLEFFNTQQSLEWQLNFCEAETLLLNSLKHVHWRTYVITSLIFRAFLAPLGPQGIGVEHIRNILYFMCHEDFVGWNDEQPGVHLRAILSKLFNCLGKGKMPNFFIQSQDLLKSIPPQNVRLVQAHLSHLRDNLIVYCIYAFRNLTCVQKEESFYPMANLKKLYQIITAPAEKDLLQIVTPGLAFGGIPSDDESKTKKPNARKKKSDKLDIIANEDAIEDDFRTFIAVRPTNKADKMQSRLRKKHLEYEQKLREQVARQKERNFLKTSPDAKIPSKEKRKSIDLKQLPVIQEHFSPMRKVLVIDFFIKHFISMARKSNEFRAYSQSAMYIMQVENLCKILLEPKMSLAQTPVDALMVEEYLTTCETLRQVVGKEMREYILTRFSHLNSPYLTTHHILNEMNKSRGAFHNNWDFRKLPTPPGSHVDLSEFGKSKNEPATRMPPTTKRLETPNIAKTLQSISTTSIPSETSSAKLARRAESIKFIDKPVAMKRSTSRQSIVLVNDEFESTDL